MLSVDYAGLVASVDDPTDLVQVGALLLEAAGDRYVEQFGACGLQEFEQFGAHYLFDLASPHGLPQEDRTVAAWA